MHMAALNDDVDGMVLLLKYGANKQSKSEDGHTTLDMARKEGSKMVIALLTNGGRE
jgi:ankyrin repeat protein